MGILLQLLLQAEDSVLGSVVLGNPEDGNQNDGESQGGHRQQETQNSAQMGGQVGRWRNGIIESQRKGAINDNLVFKGKKPHESTAILNSILSSAG